MEQAFTIPGSYSLDDSFLKPRSELVISDNFKVTMTTKRPNWFHRLMVKLLLGWEWKEIA